ncbi:MAG: galactosyldiacylglycerol synthase [Clostridia bacterium]|nr:galactosyldiacylglycerol synthase [Clostridia bacterium]
MNFLICSVTAGEGHNSTAKAIRAEFERSGHDCTILDTFDYIAPELAKIISEGYLFVTEKAAYAYRLGYRLAERERKHPISSKLPDKLTGFFHDGRDELITVTMTDDLAAYINQGGFDLILFTHPFAGALLAMMKKRRLIRCRTIGILTDFTFHPYWEQCTANEYVVVPDSLLLPQARRKGFSDSQILPLGIPINPKFASFTGKSEARHQLGLDENLPTFLLMGGSMGYGSLAENVRKIDSFEFDKNFQLIAVCGNNAEAKAEIDAYAEHAKHPILVTGFVDYVSLLMDASDCIITKPGGLTTSESLAKGLPMIIVNPIPGQEERNTEFLLNTGCAMASTKTCPIEECMYQLLSSETRLSSMADCIRAIAKPESTKNVCAFAVDLAHTPFIEDCAEESDSEIYIYHNGSFVKE